MNNILDCVFQRDLEELAEKTAAPSKEATIACVMPTTTQ
jgi:hypothetical protein